MFSAVKANPAFVYTVGNAPLIYTNGHGHGEHLFFFSLFRSITELLHRKFALGRRYHHARKSLQYQTTLGRLPSQPNDIYVQVLFHCTTRLLATHIPRTLLSKGK